MSSGKSATESQPSPIDHQRAEDFREGYANNVFLESNVWDLTLRFGQLDATLGPNTVIQHTGMTLPWPQVKVMIYLLQTHLMAYEFDQGRVPVPKGVIPVPVAPTADTMKLNPKAAEVHAMFRKHYEEFVAVNPEMVPAK